MPDLVDVLDTLYDIAEGACYPSGTTIPSLTGKPIDVEEGWPEPDDLEAAMRAGRTLVTIYAQSGTSDPGQSMCWDVEVVAPPVHGMTATAADTGFTLTGTPGVGEYATAVLDGKHSYSYAAVANDTTSAVAAALVAQVAADYPGTSASGASVSIVGAHDIVVRIGAPATVGQQLHRQKQLFRITVWAPDPPSRATVAAAVDVALKRNQKLNFPDTSQGILTYQSTFLSDREEKRGEYRRDFMYTVIYDTYYLDTAYEVTSVNITLDAGVGAPVSGVR